MKLAFATVSITSMLCVACATDPTTTAEESLQKPAPDPECVGDPTPVTGTGTANALILYNCNSLIGTIVTTADESFGQECQEANAAFTANQSCPAGQSPVVCSQSPCKVFSCTSTRVVIQVAGGYECQ